VAQATDAAATSIARGRKLYTQVCVSCHGPEGNLIADHKLSTLAARRDLPAIIGYIEDPKAPMPKLYPDLLSEQNVTDVATYVRQELAR
jgi:mono/diheme cytochrome c family protein